MTEFQTAALAIQEAMLAVQEAELEISRSAILGLASGISWQGCCKRW